MGSQVRRSVVLRRHPSEARRARREVGEVCADLPRDVSETARLLTSELIANAIEHGTGDIVLSVTRAPNHVRVGVTDGHPDPPRSRPAELDEARGRGILLVESLAARWGVEPAPDGPGKTVWFMLRTG